MKTYRLSWDVGQRVDRLTFQARSDQQAAEVLAVAEQLGRRAGLRRFVVTAARNGRYVAGWQGQTVARETAQFDLGLDRGEAAERSQD